MQQKMQHNLAQTCKTLTRRRVFSSGSQAKILPIFARKFLTLGPIQRDTGDNFDFFGATKPKIGAYLARRRQKFWLFWREKAKKRPKIGPHSIQKVCSGSSSIFALRFSSVLNSDLFKSCNSEIVHGGKPEKSSLTPCIDYKIVN